MKYLFFILLLSFNLQAQIFDFEGNAYDTVRIGNQVWIKQNIRSTKYADGTPITSGIYAYNDDTVHVASNGYLYAYSTTVRNSTVTAAQGICPNNFHVPNQTDWGLLLNSIGSTAVGPSLYTNANELKDNTNWNGINTYSFNVLPSGKRASGSYVGLGSEVWYWLSGSSIIDLVYFFDSGSYIKTYSSAPTTNINDGLSCRCVMNGSSVGINEINYLNDVSRISPNPTSGEFVLVLNNIEQLPESIIISNLLGEEIKVIKNIVSNEYKFNLNDLSNGLYIINIVYSNKTLSKKIVKQ